MKEVRSRCASRFSGWPNSGLGLVRSESQGSEPVEGSFLLVKNPAMPCSGEHLI